VNVQRLAGLLQHLGAEPDERDLLDTLWLAQYVQAGPGHGQQARPGHSGFRAAGDPEPIPPLASHVGPPGKLSATERSYPIHARSPAQAPLSGGLRASALRAPEMPALGGRLALAKALRPLRRSAPSPSRLLLDEEATANRIANEGIWVPALTPAPVRWLELALIVDGYESMAIWRKLVADLRGLLENLGAFQDLRVWLLDHGQRGAAGLELRRWPNGPSARSPRELIHPAGRRVIAVLTDCLGPRWQDGSARQLLATWASRGPVAILQPLPQRLWEFSHERPVSVRLCATSAALPNARLKCRPTASDPMSEPARAVPVPVFEIGPAWLASWSRLLVAAGESNVDAMAIMVDGNTPPQARELPVRKQDLTPRQRVRRFRAVASPDAIRLAEYLSAAPISLPVIRLVQGVMLDRAAGSSQLAEVFLGGLLQRKTADIGVDPDEVLYDFLPGVRELLLERLRQRDALCVLRAVSDFVQAHFGQARDFRALLAGVDTGDFVVSPDSIPFAEVAAQVLGFYGGPHESAAMVLSAALTGTSGELPGIVRAANLLAPDRDPPVRGKAWTNQFEQALSQVRLADVRSRRRPLVCPYCYHAFAESEIKYRCSGRASVGRKPCPEKPDPVLQKMFGLNEPLPPVFSASGQRETASCPTCDQPTRIQVCPVCHSQLPADFRKVQGRIVAMIGPSESGKTAFMTVLIHELRGEAGEILNSTTIGADYTTLERYAQQFERPLYENSEPVRRTVTIGQQSVEPLVFRLTVEQPRRRLPASHHQLLMSFADSAGEDLASLDKVELMARYVSAADAVIVLVDPLQLPSVREQLGPGAMLPNIRDDHERPAESFDRITKLLQAGQGQAKIDKPVAIVVSKLDAVHDLLPQISLLRQPKPTTPYFDNTASQSMQQELEGLLSRWGAGEITTTAQREYSRFRYFAVSALGATPTAENPIPPGGIRPYRVTEPLLWLLSQFGLVGQQ